MPRLEIEGAGTVEVESGKRLVLAIEQDAGVDVMHRCGGNAKRTTRRVEFLGGEPESMTRAELEALEKRGEPGNFRLSCQACCENDMNATPDAGLRQRGRRPRSRVRRRGDHPRARVGPEATVGAGCYAAGPTPGPGACKRRFIEYKGSIRTRQRRFSA